MFHVKHRDRRSYVSNLELIDPAKWDSKVVFHVKHRSTAGLPLDI